MLDILIPTLNRPSVLAKVSKNVHENTRLDHRLYFVIEPGDWDSYRAVKNLQDSLIISKYPGTHTGAANTAYEETSSQFFMMANDDLNFHPGWDVAALLKMEGNIGVVGLNDGLNHMTTFTLVRREYIKNHSGCMDVPGVVYFPGYHHNYVDTEFAATAKKRGMWSEAPESVVEHMHWSFNKSEKDETYKQSEGTAFADSLIYESRKHLFT